MGWFWPEHETKNRSSTIQTETNFVPATEQTFRTQLHYYHPNDDVTIRNGENSRLHQLPAELILHIYSYLEDSNPYRPHVSKMVFSGTCRRFRAMLPGPPYPAGKWSVPDRRGYSILKKGAYHREICAQERSGQLGMRKLVCGICKLVHDRSCFTNDEVARRPEERICIGAQGVFELCPHVRVNYAGLKLHPVDVLCNSPHDYFSGLQIRQPDDYCGPGRTVADRSKSRARIVQVEEEGVYEGIKSEAELRLFRLGTVDGSVLEKDLTKGMVLGAVEKTGWKLCPHLHARSGALWLSFLHQDIEQPSRATYKRWFWPLCKEEDRVWPTHICSTDNCDTRVSLAKERTVPQKGVARYEYLVMRVERYLGRMEGANDPRWMAQIVGASTLADDKLR